MQSRSWCTCRETLETHSKRLEAPACAPRSVLDALGVFRLGPALLPQPERQNEVGPSSCSAAGEIVRYPEASASGGWQSERGLGVSISQGQVRSHDVDREGIHEGP